MKTIVAPTDFSSISLNAVNYAADMAQAMNASLSLLYVSPVPMAFSEIPYPPENFDELERNGEEWLLQLKRILEQRTAGKLRIHTAVRIGVVATELIEYCQSIKPYAVVMATKGDNAVERTLFGSNTISALKHLSWPLIIVPAAAKFMGIKTVALACDLKDVVDSPVKEIVEMVKQFGARLFVLHVTKHEEVIYGVDTVEESIRLNEMLQELHPAYRFIANASIEDGLTEFAEHNKVDMMIVIPKKLNIIEQLFHKSQSKRLALHSHVPIMAMHE